MVTPTGLSVISDIDDTIKVSDVLNRKNLMRHTFYEDIKAAFEGIPVEKWQLFSDANHL